MATQKIYLFTAYLSASGLKKNHRWFQCKEKEKIYISDRIKIGQRHIKKEEILKLKSSMKDGLFHVIQFHTWYVDGQKDQAERMVIEHLYSIAKKQADTANELLNHIKNEPYVIS